MLHAQQNSRQCHSLYYIRSKQHNVIVWFMFSSLRSAVLKVPVQTERVLDVTCPWVCETVGIVQLWLSGELFSELLVNPMPMRYVRWEFMLHRYRRTAGVSDRCSSSASWGRRGVSAGNFSEVFVLVAPEKASSVLVSDATCLKVCWRIQNKQVVVLFWVFHIITKAKDPLFHT